jgi:hypothetical protein
MVSLVSELHAFKNFGGAHEIAIAEAAPTRRHLDLDLDLDLDLP